MTELRAMIVTARLEIAISFDDKLKSALMKEAVMFESAYAMMPEWARPFGQGDRLHLNPAKSAFEERQDFVAIRAEFARKAKKIGLKADSDVSMRFDKDCLLLWCTARGRA